MVVPRDKTQIPIMNYSSEEEVDDDQDNDDDRYDQDNQSINYDISSDRNNCAWE